MIDLGALVVDQEANALITVRSKAGTYNLDGKWIEGTPVDVEGIKAVVQPASGRKLNDLPEGVRESAVHFLWTRFALELGDIVVFAGQQWRTVFVWDRSIEAGYTRAAIGKLK